jgi:uncharacterized repeat protein (TIGR04138 family)
VERDRDEVIRDIVRRDGRYAGEAYTFLLESLDFTISRRGKGKKHVAGPELLDGFRDLALETFGFLARCWPSGGSKRPTTSARSSSA